MRGQFPNVMMLIFSLLFGAFCSINVIPNSINSSAVNNTVDDSFLEELEKTYFLDFGLSKRTYSSINNYLVDRRQTTYSQAKDIKQKFGFSGDLSEDEDSYYISDDSGVLRILKDFNVVKYFKKNDDLLYRQLDKNEIITIASEYLAANGLMFNYEEALVNSDGDFYSIDFVSRLNDIKNFAFTNKMLLDRCGNIISLEFNFIEYKRFNSIRLISMSEAYLKLPIFHEQETRIILNGGELVYFYEDSIVQPAYRFYGLLEDGRGFECYVKAAYFGR